jgi:hypothetical protein
MATVVTYRGRKSLAASFVYIGVHLHCVSIPLSGALPRSQGGGVILIMQIQANPCAKEMGKPTEHATHIYIYIYIYIYSDDSLHSFLEPER